jgi:hypothetical protein
VAWGDNSQGQCNVPALPAGLTYVEIATGHFYTAARRSDGSIVAWGGNTCGVCNVSTLPPGLTYVGIAASKYHTAARRSDGSVVAWGCNAGGQCNVPTLPAGLTYVEVAAGGSYISGSGHTVARRSDGSVVAWGDNTYGQCDVPVLPPGLTYVELSARDDRTVARVGSMFAITSFCFGDGSGAACPCGNSGMTGHGCENSGGTGGAVLSGTGTANLSADSVQLTSSGERPNALSIFLQGNVQIAPVHFGDGLRCTGGALKRLFVKSASGGLVTAPQSGDPSVSARSAALGDPIPLGATREYQVYYRDSNASFCPNPQGGSFNVSNAIAIAWGS